MSRPSSRPRWRHAQRHDEADQLEQHEGQRRPTRPASRPRRRTGSAPACGLPSSRPGDAVRRIRADRDRGGREHAASAACRSRRRRRARRTRRANRRSRACSLSSVQAQKQTRRRSMPMTMPCHGSTKPDAGVMVPRPATAPEIMPSTDGLPRVHHSSTIQVSAPARPRDASPRSRSTARELAPSAEPPLKPNQPTHSRPVPITASDRSYGAKFSVP